VVPDSIERVFVTAIFAKQKPRDVERSASGEPNLDRERNDYESRSCSNDGWISRSMLCSPQTG